jgi:hypothetical protein
MESVEQAGSLLWLVVLLSTARHGKLENNIAVAGGAAKHYQAWQARK